MKEQDLKIGNLIDLYGKQVRVIGIDKTLHGDYHVTYNDGEKDYRTARYLDQFEPIPLTEEWLVRLKDDGSFKLRFIKSIAAFEVQRKYVGIESGEEWIFISNVRYVHEWQNLHHALTGEELELKP